MFHLAPNKLNNVLFVNDQGIETEFPTENVDDEFARNVQRLEEVEKNNKKRRLDDGEPGDEEAPAGSRELAISAKPEEWPFAQVAMDLRATSHEVRQLLHLLELVHQKKGFVLENVPQQPLQIKTEFQRLNGNIIMKQRFVEESLAILKRGLDKVTESHQREVAYIAALFDMQRRWRIVAPGHGRLLSGLRAQEPLAIDCSCFTAGGSDPPPGSEVRLFQDDQSNVKVQLSAELFQVIQVRVVDQATNLETCAYTVPLALRPVAAKVAESGVEGLSNEEALQVMLNGQFFQQLFERIKTEATMPTAKLATKGASLKLMDQVDVMELYLSSLKVRVTEHLHVVLSLVDLKDAGSTSNSGATRIAETISLVLQRRYRDMMRHGDGNLVDDPCLLRTVVDMGRHHSVCTALETSIDRIRREINVTGSPFSKFGVEFSIQHQGGLYTVCTVKVGRCIRALLSVKCGIVELAGVSRLDHGARISGGRLCPEFNDQFFTGASFHAQLMVLLHAMMKHTVVGELADELRWLGIPYEYHTGATEVVLEVAKLGKQRVSAPNLPKGTVPLAIKFAVRQGGLVGVFDVDGKEVTTKFDDLPGASCREQLVGLLLSAS